MVLLRFFCSAISFFLAFFSFNEVVVVAMLFDAVLFIFGDRGT